MFIVESSGMIEQGSRWILKRFEQPAQRNFESWWVEADVQECWDKKGRVPIAVRWVDVDKGFGVYHSRLVAKDLISKSKVNDQEGLFAVTPPLELVKMVNVKAAKGSSNEHAHVRKVMFLDVSKAHLYAPVLDKELVQLPPEKWTER